MRERETACKSEGRAEKRERRERILSKVCTVGTEPNTDLTNQEMMT